jgi:hypothetical protein
LKRVVKGCHPLKVAVADWVVGRVYEVVSDVWVICEGFAGVVRAVTLY